MKLLKIEKWNDLLSEIKAHRLFKTNLTNRQSKMLLAAPVLAARQILNNAAHLLNKDHLRICIAGSDFLDSGNNGDAYRLLPMLLDKPDITIKVDLVGPDCMPQDFNDDYVLKALDTKQVSVSFRKLLLGEYLRTEQLPDVIILNMPGFEEHSDDWFVHDDGIQKALMNNIPVLGSSYSDDEAELDGIYACGHGFNVSNIQRNPFTFNEGTENTFFTWAGETWVLNLGSGKTDDELLELCEIRVHLVDEYVDLHSEQYSGKELIEQVPVILKTITGESNGNKYIWIADGIYYFPEINSIKDEDGDIIFDDVSLDTTYIHTIKNERLKATLSAAVIRRDFDISGDSLYSDEDGLSDDDFVNAFRLNRPVSPTDCAEGLKTYLGWDVEIKSTAPRKEHLESTFSIHSNGISYPVVVVGLGATIYDYHENADPLLIEIIESLKERYSCFILLVGEGAFMQIDGKEESHHLLGVIYKNEIASFLFFCNVAPDDQHGRFNITDKVALPEWSIADSSLSSKYMAPILNGVANMLQSAINRSLH